MSKPTKEPVVGTPKWALDKIWTGSVVRGIMYGESVEAIGDNTDGIIVNVLSTTPRTKLPPMGRSMFLGVAHGTGWEETDKWLGNDKEENK